MSRLTCLEKEKIVKTMTLEIAKGKIDPKLIKRTIFLKESTLNPGHSVYARQGVLHPNMVHLSFAHLFYLLSVYKNIQ